MFQLNSKNKKIVNEEKKFGKIDHRSGEKHLLIKSKHFQNLETYCLEKNSFSFTI